MSQSCVTFIDRYDAPQAWDFLNDCDDKMDLKYPTFYKDCEVEGDVHYALLGRGDNDFLLEPVMFGYDMSTWYNKTIQPYLGSVAIVRG